jgi:hypothetical protein
MFANDSGLTAKTAKKYCRRAAYKNKKLKTKLKLKIVLN